MAGSRLVCVQGLCEPSVGERLVVERRDFGISRGPVQRDGLGQHVAGFQVRVGRPVLAGEVLEVVKEPPGQTQNTSSRAGSATHMRLMSVTLPGWCLTAPRPMASPCR